MKVRVLTNMTASVILEVVRAVAILASGIVYGTDAFFSIVGPSALGRASSRSLTEVMGLLHETADRRMPFVGATGLITSLACGSLAQTTSGKILGATAALLQIAYLALYARYSKPINVSLIAATRAGEARADAHALQRRWDGVVRVRFVLMAASMICLIFFDRST